MTNEKFNRLTKEKMVDHLETIEGNDLTRMEMMKKTKADLITLHDDLIAPKPVVEDTKEEISNEEAQELVAEGKAEIPAEAIVDGGLEGKFEPELEPVKEEIVFEVKNPYGNIKVMLINDKAVMPFRANPGDAGADLVATEKIENGDYIEYKTGVAMEIPEGFVGLVFPRSSIRKMDLTLANCVGVIDAGYRGEISFSFKPTLTQKFFGFLGTLRRHFLAKNNFMRFKTMRESDAAKKENKSLFELHGTLDNFFRTYEVGDRVGQIVIMPISLCGFEQAESLSSSERGEGGHGSTGQ
jgi:dUTP pyrophosphatase